MTSTIDERQPARSRPDPAAIEHYGMSLQTHFQPEMTVVEVQGAVDACNAERLSDHIAELASRDRALILDLRGVDFFGGEGIRLLAKIAATCQREGVRWSLVSSGAVDRLLRTTGTNHGLPIAASYQDALQRLSHYRPAEAPRARRVAGMGKIAEKLKAALVQHNSAGIPDKQINRWEGEGGAVYMPRPRRRSIRRRRTGDTPVDGGKAV